VSSQLAFDWPSSHRPFALRSSPPTQRYSYPADADFPQFLANTRCLSASLDPTTARNGDDDGGLDEDEPASGTDFQRADADDVSDGCDNCPIDSNPDKQDADDNGMGNICDICDDRDNDGIDNDNCPADANPTQGDADDNGVGHACEPGEADTNTDVATDTNQDRSQAPSSSRTENASDAVVEAGSFTLVAVVPEGVLDGVGLAGNDHWPTDRLDSRTASGVGTDRGICAQRDVRGRRINGAAGTTCAAYRRGRPSADVLLG
jgi:hypothetical protein